jgi:hypothetical protein
MTEKSILVQDSNYWESWQESKLYSLQINIFNANIEAETGSMSNPVDSYVVIFLTKDRANSKKKTSMCKKSFSPAWHECVVFTGLDITEKVTIELKMPTWGSLNPVLASYTFSMSDIVNITHGERKSKIYSLTPNFQGILAAHVTLGFSFNPPVSGRSAEEFTGDMPVSLNACGAFTSLLFTNDNAGPAEGTVTLKAPPGKGGHGHSSPRNSINKGSSSTMKLFSNPSFDFPK